jgi:signal transduction histidine kinase
MAPPRRFSPRVSLRWLTGLVVCVIGVAAVTALVVVLSPHVPGSSVLVLYLIVIVPAAIVWGIGLAVLVAFLCAGVYDYFFTPPLYSFDIYDPQNAVGLGIFLVTAVVVGELAARLRRAVRESARLYQEQSALLRVATLAAQSVSPSPVFDAVTREVGLLCGADLARMYRYDGDDAATRVAVWSTVGGELAVGTRLALIGPSVARDVRQTGRPARIFISPGATGPIARDAIEVGIRSTVGCPIVVAGRLWGVFAASTKTDKPFPPETESQIARFTDIVATAILTSAESRAELAASRARVVAAADEARRRLERDLHDGAQQRLVSLGLELRRAQHEVPADLPALVADLGRIAEELNEALEELRILSQGLHPAILSEAGLGPALRALARRSAVAVELHVNTKIRYPPAVEASAYYVISEALTNTIKHARASRAEVIVEERDAALWVSVADDGIGGADPRGGSGLIGLRDRVEAAGGTIEVISALSAGTTIQASLPIGRLDGESPQSWWRSASPAAAGTNGRRLVLDQD